VSEGQTFTKKVGAAILPDFLSVYDDPTASEYRGIPLMGHYGFDDEGVPAQRAAVVENGILRGFLMSRSPVKGFPRSNGHGRCAPGNLPVARMANTILESSKRLPFDRLREMLVEEARKQGKPYGLVFHDITGGFTATGRGGPQSFKVLPLLVTRVYVDGRPEEVVRGVDICGTPIMSLEQILATGDDVGAFHGFCGAESGSVPVSCLSPSLLVGKIEIEKKRKSQDRPPILPPPLHDPQPAKEKGK
jgi:predicted Zn-dependent protease